MYQKTQEHFRVPRAGSSQRYAHLYNEQGRLDAYIPTLIWTAWGRLVFTRMQIRVICREKVLMNAARLGDALPISN